MSLFITHGGYNSIIEGITNGVPLLLLPLFFDQHRNSKAMEYRKVARILSPHLINTDTLKRELSTLLNNKMWVKN
jgi:UDP:flavonoid glycosyltransferase YjiC (YdhE family)